jgi:hypothetical protein
MIHVFPLDDIEEHNLSDSGNTCKCDPKVIIQLNAEIIVVHNSFDGREGIEWANEILKQ